MRLFFLSITSCLAYFRHASNGPFMYLRSDAAAAAANTTVRCASCAFKLFRQSWKQKAFTVVPRPASVMAWLRMADAPAPMDLR